ncbi:MAG: sulfite exporter TauE/SafE family protein [Gaiellales bacterium]
MDITLVTICLAIGCGVAAGLLAGLFGVGGGVIFVPTLVLVFAFTQLDAQATSLAAIVPVAAVGAWRQTTGDNVYWRGALLMGIGAAGGVIVGAEIATRLPNATLSQVFGAVLILSGGEMIVSASRRLKAKRASAPSADPHRP